MKTDIEIAQSAKLRPIEEIASACGLTEEEVEPHGKYKAKITLSVLRRLQNKPNGKLILVSTMTPTPKGEGKTTITIGLAQAIAKFGNRSFVAIREPSLGPVMGVKGGAAGGGYSQVLPMEDINLHFVGDIHVITSAHNLLSALVDNHLYQGNSLGIEPGRITWKRVMDMNDRALRNVTLQIGDIRRESGFDITASSEVMAIMCLSQSITDMKERLSKIIVGFSYKWEPITAGDLKAGGAMALLMKDALKPNLVQTIEGVPAFVHGGPFANIAHGCNSLLATKMALKLSDYVVTEAGFGSDLGAEKFFDIKCRVGELSPDAAVLVVSVRALKRQGGIAVIDLDKENPAAVEAGLPNLRKHVENIKAFGIPIVLAINKALKDSKQEINVILKGCETLDLPISISEVWERGGEGGKDLAEKVIKAAEGQNNFRFLYDVNESIEDKIGKIAKTIYGAKGVTYSEEAGRDIRELEKLKLDKLPICVAKTQYSLTDDPKKLGRPKEFNIAVKKLRASAGAGFIVVYTGDIVTMPGLPKVPAAEGMDIDEDGKIKGLF
ncbi:MAG: formate--tetrahydrofolate ligase [Candidatus Saganbacteria bacterium]|nr:formate--tetrahydrofolate ligase [Candidatus Saganbacteria bacterium]